MIKRIIVLTLLMGLFTLPVSASNWYYVGKALDPNHRVYIDNDSIIKDSNSATIWIKNMYRNGAYTLARMHFIRRTREVKVLSISSHYVNGQINQSAFYPNSPYQPIIPDTPLDKIYHLIW